ncbi:hypothetical protein K469DRAFT_191617 [Zopfia rhizophila CBS 207.26]|uniref:Uncharacterized protein n=1 Tax=Zopfia rhizophila CBS 207.26 TaxID=1314779 RepID=A0A6A6ETK4_9PEZI|nr:hypothetical protein K469DRAFT_191617 [Zopfia rhizophila CBS 207.26]
MAPRRGIKIGGSYIASLRRDELPLATRLLPREASRTARLAIGIGSLVALLAIIGFCAFVVILMLKKQRQRRRRQSKMESSRFNQQHRYKALNDQELDSGLQELPTENEVMQADSQGIYKPQEIDGYAAPQRSSFEPVELPPDAYTAGTKR